MEKIIVNTPGARSEILVGENWESVKGMLPEKGVVIITDDNIKNIYGIYESKFLPVSIPILNDNIKEIVQAAGISLFEDMQGMSRVRNSNKSVCSYVLLDVDREKLDKVYPILKLTDNILYCDYTEGNYNLILLIYGTQFSEIDKIIENKIINLGGVLKVKEYPIINVFEM